MCVMMPSEEKMSAIMILCSNNVVFPKWMCDSFYLNSFFSLKIIENDLILKSEFRVNFCEEIRNFIVFLVPSICLIIFPTIRNGYLHSMFTLHDD